MRAITTLSPTSDDLLNLTCWDGTNKQNHHMWGERVMIARILFWCKMALQQGRYWWINDKKLSLIRHVLNKGRRDESWNSPPSKGQVLWQPATCRWVGLADTGWAGTETIISSKVVQTSQRPDIESLHLCLHTDKRTALLGSLCMYLVKKLKWRC